MESAAWLIQAAAMHCPEWLAISGFPIKGFLEMGFWPVACQAYADYN
jgi:hypothetical protein